MSNESDHILSRLADIEAAEGVSILYACEAGSRAWGFASPDSDWDVRFIYLRPRDWYLSIDLEKKRDVIERPVADNLDISGWDLRKALRLFGKSNPPLIEWLNSPSVYLDRAGLADHLRQLLPAYYSARSCFHHYLHMASGNYREYLRGERVRTKKYLYVLRPLLALRWLETRQTTVPVRCEELREETLPAGPVKEALESLLAQKRQDRELDEGPRIPVLNDFIEAELARLRNLADELPKPAARIEPLNELFREMLGEVRRGQEGMGVI